MKKFLRWLAVPALAVGLLAAGTSPALASGDIWHRGQADYYYGTNNTVDVELSMHTWTDSTQVTHIEGNMFVNTLAANDVKAIDVLHVYLWKCHTDGTSCVLAEIWPDYPNTFCLATCGNPNFRLDTDNHPYQSFLYHVEAIYQLKWSNGTWSNNKDENSGNVSCC